MRHPERLRRLLNEFGISWTHADLSARTTLKIGPRNARLLLPSSIDQALTCFRILQEEEIPWKILGGGSNVVIEDRAAPSYMVISLERLNFIHREGRRLRVGAGVPAPKLAGWTAAQGLGGLEFISGIPGQIGGLIRMNAGAFGRRMDESLTRVWAWDAATGTYGAYTTEPELFGYRSSPFQGAWVILQAEFCLTQERPERLKERLRVLRGIRRKTQPWRFPNAGCAFKNPLYGEVSAGALLDRAGMKGHAVGAAQFSEIHANFIINRGGATFAQVRELVKRGREAVARRFGLELEPELVFWHDEPRSAPGSGGYSLQA